MYLDDSIIPAKAGVLLKLKMPIKIPAFAGMTKHIIIQILQAIF